MGRCRFLDTIATIALFIVLIGWVWLAIYVGATSVTLSDSGAPGIAFVGVVLAVVGIPLSVIAVYVIAVIRVWRANGYTFYYPLVAFVVGTALAALVMGLADGHRSTRPSPSRHRRGAFGRSGGRSRDGTTSRRPQRLPHPECSRSTPRNEFRDGYLIVELGVEQATGRCYLRTPVPQRNGEWEEYYYIDLREYETCAADAAAARRVRRRVPSPRTRRQMDILGPDRLHPSRSRATGRVWPRSVQSC